jgi:hypothetical protein
VGELVVGGDDDAVAGGVKLGATGAAKDLHHVEDAQVDERAVFGVVYLSSLDTRMST